MKDLRKTYERPFVDIISLDVEQMPICGISATHPGYDENDDPWGDTGGGANEWNWSADDDRIEWDI